MSDKLSDIAACPFCDDHDPEVAESSVPSALTGRQKLAVYCNACFCEGPTAESEASAIAAWNRRASPAPAIPAEPIDEAVAAVRACLEQHAVYFSRSSIEEIVNAARKAAPASPAEVADKNTPIDDLVTSYQQDGFDFMDGPRVKTTALRYVESMPDSHARALLFVLASAPAISESEDALLTAARRAIPALAHAAERNPVYQRDYEELSRAIDDGTRKGEKS